MDTRKKRALLAHLEGQLVVLGKQPAASERARRRVERTLGALAGLTSGPDEARRLTGLRQRLDALDADLADGLPCYLIEHRCTLARADCLLWQMALRNIADAEDAIAA